MTRSRSTTGIVIGLVLIFSTGPVDARAVLTVCIDRASPLATMDARVAQAAALSQGYGLRIEQFDGQGLGDEAYSADNFRKLAGGLCQLVLGFPVDAKAAALPEGVLATKPYAQTGFVLLTRKRQAPGGLAGLPMNTKVGVTFETAPNLYFHDHPGLKPEVFRESTVMVDSVASGKLAAAMVWQPTLAHQTEGNAGLRKLFTQPLDEAHARWNLVALHVAESAAAANVFEQGIATLHAAGRLSELLEPFAVDRAVNVDPPVPTPISIRPHASRRDAGHLIATAAARRGKASKRPAIYTAEQATSGLSSYALNCSYCHGAALEGRTGPALKGEKFASVAANFVVGDIFFVLAMQMPAGKPGTLPKQEYEALMAYLLQQNGYPAGAKKLDYDAALQSVVPLIYSGP